VTRERGGRVRSVSSAFGRGSAAPGGSGDRSAACSRREEAATLGAIAPQARASSGGGALGVLGVADRPGEALDELRGGVAGGQVDGLDALIQEHGGVWWWRGGVCDDDYTRHGEVDPFVAVLRVGGSHSRSSWRPYYPLAATLNGGTANGPGQGDDDYNTVSQSRL
jgi:hypothetical protein